MTISTFGCPHCGHSNPTNAHFCSHCGANLQEIDTQSLVGGTPGQTGEEPTPSLGARPPEEASPPLRPEDQPWLQPDFADQETGSSPPPDQPWLEPEAEPASASPPSTPPPRLLTGLQGLIEPTDPLELVPYSSGASDLHRQLAVDDGERRRLREMFSREAPLAEDTGPFMDLGDRDGGAGRGLHRRRWLEWLLLAGLIVGLLFGDRSPESGPHIWPGVLQAHERIDTLPLGSSVLVYWAYDPATAGEMDQVTRPVIEHLLRRQARLVVVSQLPGGPASARRLIAQAETAVLAPGQPRGTVAEAVEGGFLPGGAASLPLLGRAPAQVLPVDPALAGPRDKAVVASLAETGPALTVVAAARAEDVQRWLEQVQTLNDAPVIAVTSAAVDPAVRPYWDSAQLNGLVSGWDGGDAYQRLSMRPLDLERQERNARLLTGQNWGFGLLMLILVLGNLAVLAERRLP